MEVLCEMYVIRQEGLRAIMAAGGDSPPSSYDNERVASDLVNTESCHLLGDGREHNNEDRYEMC